MKQPPCPFYAAAYFNLGVPVLLKHTGNRCALVVHSHSPCLYDQDATGPDWRRCAKNDDADAITLVKEIREKGKVMVQGEENARNFKDWENYVMTDKSST